MSGFDFGSLRDPEAPIPGARHREGVEMRARELATRARRGRLLATAFVLVLVGAAVGVVGVVAATRDNNPEISITNHGTSTTVAPTSSTKPGAVATSTSS